MIDSPRASADSSASARVALPRVGVACVVMRGGRILLVRRQRSHGAGTWSPPGGHLHFGETPETCAIRETVEETGVTVSRVDFIAITNDIFTDEEKHYITLWMRAEASDGEPAVQDRAEISDVGWFDPGDLPSPRFLSLENFLAGRGLPPTVELT